MHVVAPALAGPPLSIDDPGILDPGKLEIITAVTLTSDDAGDYYQIPVLDVSFGVIEDSIQVSFVHSYASVNIAGADSKSDFGSPQAGVKWRFLNHGRLQMAFAPYFLFGSSQSAAQKGIGSTSSAAVFPVNAEFRLNDALRLNGEMRYVGADAYGSNWGYGAALAYSIDSRRELLFELAGTSDRLFDSGTLDVRLGFDASINETLHLLFSIATGLLGPEDGAKLEHDVYLGIQYFR